ncbi:ATP-binding cassette domain-containing protein [Parabacteroides chinchillae]|uniref:ABC-type nitrate/sulfonate/bicarbonate transport system, ATPase component n=1 Tax=Parabacteroides chinchillae TaxID=871327 RepID=A0A8G2BUD5_9BACT|nr:ATP-binding cassette domain-containing protein [Parabacteroides chinchillae]SEF53805.1 ABC-type nitrate/sulfonate/bicarbonate transport system, ATPase component [Parabacteroides chinchillae]
MKKKITILFSIFLLLIGWEVFAYILDQPELIPTLPRLIHTLTELLSAETFYFSIGATIARGIIGMVLSLAVASVCASLFARYELLYELFRPLLIIMQSVPVISFILLALIFLNPESIPLMIAFLTMFPLLTENLTKGIRNLQSGFSVMASLFHIGRYNTLVQVIYPQLKPFLYSGLASAVGFGWRAIIMGEVLSQCTFGIGSEMKRAQSFIAVPELMAWTIVAILVSFLFDKGINWLSVRKINIRFSSSVKREEYNLSPILVSEVGYKYGFYSFSYTFEPGKIYGISAPSGAGKTTLLNLVNGTLIPVRGKITANLNYGIASVFQEPELLPWLTVSENIALPLARLIPQSQVLQQIKEILKEMQLNDVIASVYPGSLSYGQQQRVAIARALLYRSPLILMDEPFKGLDEAVRNSIIEYIKSRQRKSGQIIIFTSHNVDELRRLADQIICLN